MGESVKRRTDVDASGIAVPRRRGRVTPALVMLVLLTVVGRVTNGPF